MFSSQSCPSHSQNVHPSTSVTLLSLVTHSAHLEWVSAPSTYFILPSTHASGSFPWVLTSSLSPEAGSRNFCWPVLSILRSSPIPGCEWDLLSHVWPCLLELLSADSLIPAFIQQSFIGSLFCARRQANSHV